MDSDVVFRSHGHSSQTVPRLISKILEDPSEALELCRHNFGHHVVQLVLERGHPRWRQGEMRRVNLK